MEITNSFIPTAGVVGLLPMVTYFFMVVAMFACIGLVIFSLATQSSPFAEHLQQTHRVSPVLTSIIAVIAGIADYTIQSYYHDVLAEFVTVSDANDRRTLIRESYNALSQFRYMALFITTPLLALQLLSLLQVKPGNNKRPFGRLVLGSSLLVFTMYIGHQQLSFGNDVQVGPLLTWGLVALGEFGFLLFTFHRLWKEFGGQAQSQFRPAALIIAAVWAIYFIGYFLTLTTVDFNWIQLAFTIADMVGIIGVGLLIYLANKSRVTVTQ